MLNVKPTIWREKHSTFNIQHLTFLVHSYEYRKAAPLGRCPPADSLAEVGSVSRRPLLGNRPRGLQRERRRLVVSAPRSRAIKSVPLVRGRHRRIFRSLSDPLLVDGLLERARSDSEGTLLRPRAERRKSRRRRQGVLLLRRRRSQPRLSA